MMHGHGMMNGWGMVGPLMWIFMLLFWGFAILGVVCAIRWSLTRGRPRIERETPLDILKARYARGEIGREEFERVKKDLE